MLFNSFDYIFFFIVVLVSFYSIPDKYRWLLLLAASFYFYMYFIPVYVLILAFLILLDYTCAILIEKSKKPKPILLLSLTGNILMLSLFKYWNFLNENIMALLHTAGFGSFHMPMLQIALPVGLSFHTFQSIGYTLDVYNGRVRAEKHLGRYALFVMFFPQLVAGPIERASGLLHQLQTRISRLNYEGFIHGLALISRGFLKKIVIADQLAIYVNSVYDHHPVHRGFTLVLATFFFAFQIYCDFSGYSDIAIGSAKLLGFDLMKNFDVPFISKSVTEFWRRWHISLSSWFKDFLFTPIIIAKRDWGKSAVVLGLLITFFLSGLWHGAGWNFALFGLIHGVALVFEFLTVKLRKKITGSIPPFLNSFLGITLTFCFVSFSWIFFRSPTFSQAIGILQNMSHNFFTLSIQDTGVFANCLFALLLFFIVEFGIFRKNDIPKLIESKKLKPLYVFNFICIVLILLFSVNTGAQFIYFQF